MNKRLVKVKGFPGIAEIQSSFSEYKGYITVKFEGANLLNGRIPPYYKLVKIEDIKGV